MKSKKFVTYVKKDLVLMMTIELRSVELRLTKSNLK